ncbi:MAG TPA: hypothetical protein VF897_15350 [Roseiflexaceae bacterium]
MWGGAARRAPSWHAVCSKAAATSLGLGYGATAGAIYAALRPRFGNLLLDGALLGLATWAIGYLGWLPASGLLPPVQEQAAEQVAAPIAQHLVFGLATVAAYQALRRII